MFFRIKPQTTQHFPFQCFASSTTKNSTRFNPWTCGVTSCSPPPHPRERTHTAQTIISQEVPQVPEEEEEEEEWGQCQSGVPHMTPTHVRVMRTMPEWGGGGILSVTGTFGEVAGFLRASWNLLGLHEENIQTRTCSNVIYLWRITSRAQCGAGAQFSYCEFTLASPGIQTSDSSAHTSTSRTSWLQTVLHHVTAMEDNVVSMCSVPCTY